MSRVFKLVHVKRILCVPPGEFGATPYCERFAISSASCKNPW